MAKRSPILGYNHNVRYRGLVFHVQTEDSGLLNPHLFTHLFHEGVIVSTRKLVYDAGSNEEAIKALMQAQHKAVMKDLRKGSFDEKIDQYLGHVPGLEPRGGARPKTEADANASAGTPIEIVNESLSEPIELPQKVKSDGAPAKARTESGDRTIPVSTPPAPGDDLDPPTDRVSVPLQQPRTKTAQKGSKAQTQTDIARAPTQLATKPPDDSAVIEISVDEDEHERSRGPRDTAVEMAIDDSAPVIATPKGNTRPPSHGAATLPAMKPPSRPIAPPVVTRPATQERKRPESDVVEVYSPPPPSVEPPPGERSERPGQYSMSRKEGAAIREKTGRLEKIQPASPQAQPLPRQRAGGGSGQVPVVGQGGRDPGQRITASMTAARPGAQPPPVPNRVQTPAAGTRVPAPAAPPNRPNVTAPLTSRAPSPATPSAGSGVVMTRPAVIVGAPPKQGPAQQRVRKAREDEGRGFGQGLISEKSLDEVILAYLSEDAEDK